MSRSLIGHGGGRSRRIPARVVVAVAAVVVLVPLAQAGVNVSWAIIPTPALDADIVRMQDIHCAAVDDCWAVGYQSLCTSVDLPDNPGLPLPVWPGGAGLCNILHTVLLDWDGSEWQRVQVVEPNVDNNQLHGVTCTASDDCWAVGWRSDPGVLGIQPLIYHWDGASWTLTVTDVPEAYLHSVDCVAPDDCWAVGLAPPYIENDAGLVTLHWDGQTWTTPWTVAGWAQRQLDRLIGTSAPLNRLFDVDCFSADHCIAVGDVYDSTGADRSVPLTASWDGTSWRIEDTPVPHPELRRHTLESVECVAADDCWAVGWSINVPNNRGGIGNVFHWDGSTWTHAEDQGGPLADVNCIAPSDCWTFGETSQRRTQISHWDGLGWTTVASPNGGDATALNSLTGGSCAAVDTCMAIGWTGVEPLSLGTVDA